MKRSMKAACWLAVVLVIFALGVIISCGDESYDERQIVSEMSEESNWLEMDDDSSWESEKSLREEKCSPCGGNYGDVLGKFRGVDAYSNGDCTGRGEGCHQCVEYINNFYGISGWGNAIDHFDSAAALGIPRYPQDSYERPAPGDMLCFGNNGWGHVAVIMEVGDNYVNVIEQNVDPNSCYRSLTMTRHNGRYNIESGLNGYWIQGWVRFEESAPLTYQMSWAYQVPDGTLHLHTGELFPPDQPFVIAYRNTGTATWYKDDITLVTCDANGNEGEALSSNLYDSGSWESRTVVTHMDQDVIGPGATARFSFKIRLPERNSGIQNYYFRVNHKTEGLLESWGGVHIPIVNHPTIQYNSHLAKIGWQGTRKNGEISGTVGQSRQMEAVKLYVPNHHVYYQVHVKDLGWLDVTSNGSQAGTTGQGRQMEAIRIWVPGKNVYYRCHVQNRGWSYWESNGHTCGSTGLGLRMEAMQVIILDNPPS